MQKIWKCLRFILLVFGVILLIYPVISNYAFVHSSKNVILEYQSEINKLSTNEIENELEKAKKYNSELKLISSFEEGENYNSILNFNEIIGYIEIEKISLELPIYHGTSEKVLENGVGHLEWTSLPIGGIGTHSILTAHNGLEGKKLFDDINKLEIGDKFSINVLDKKLEYEVDKIDVILPDDIDSIEFNPNKDYVTLLTCTPYKINTHRLLVRGNRINQDEGVLINEK